MKEKDYSKSILQWSSFWYEIALAEAIYHISKDQPIFSKSQFGQDW
jgi:hypothetical protein